MDYEQKIKELEDIIARLESGEAKFDEATALFEKGAVLCRELSNYFDTTKGKVTVIREELCGLLKEEELN